MKVILFGAGKFGRLFCENCDEHTTIIAFADNNATLKGNKTIYGHMIISVDEIKQYDYDRIVITLDDRKDGIWKIHAIVTQLTGLGIELDKLVLQNLRYSENEPRVQFLKHFAEIFDTLSFAVAECGVYRGEFAAHINECFPNNKLYLFDAFQGFREEDQAAERSCESQAWLKKGAHYWHNLDGNEFPAILRCPYRNNIVLRKGFVPDTFSDTPEEKYGFVHLDMDLFAPTLQALRYFASRLERGGVILLHDYFCSDLPGIKQAVDEFSLEYSFYSIPIGDEFSLVMTNIHQL